MDPVRIRDWSADLLTSTMGGSAALCPPRPLLIAGPGKPAVSLDFAGCQVKAAPLK
jgi:hypothetical protein